MDSDVINSSNFKNLLSFEKNRLLLKAVKYDLSDLAKKSIEAGANIDALDETGDSVLMSATYLERANIVALLINLGANLDTQDDLFGNNALMLAVLTGNLYITSLLLEAKANPELNNALNQTAFGCAFTKNHTELIYLLFSVMSQQQLNNEIRIQPNVETEYRHFQQAVIQHRMDGFKKLGPLILDKNNLNPFNDLPLEIKEFILLYYCQAKHQHKWQVQHAQLDTQKICDSLYHYEPMVFSHQVQKKKKSNALSNFVDKTLCPLMKNLKIKHKK